MRDASGLSSKHLHCVPASVTGLPTAPRWFVAVGMAVLGLITVALLAACGTNPKPATFVTAEAGVTTPVSTDEALVSSEEPRVSGEDPDCKPQVGREDLGAPSYVDLDNDGRAEEIVAIGQRDEGAGPIIEFSVGRLAAVGCERTELTRLRLGAWRDVDGGTGTYEWVCAFHSFSEGTKAAAVDLVQLRHHDSPQVSHVTVFDMTSNGFVARPPTVVDGLLPSTSYKVHADTGPATCVPPTQPFAYDSVAAARCAAESNPIGFATRLPPQWHTMIVGEWACETFASWPMQWPCQCDQGHVVRGEVVAERFDDAVKSRGATSVSATDGFGRLAYQEQLSVDNVPTGSPEDHLRTYVAGTSWAEYTLVVEMAYSTVWHDDGPYGVSLSYERLVSDVETLIRQQTSDLSYQAAQFDPSPPPPGGYALAGGEPRCVTNVPSDDPLNIRSGPGLDYDVIEQVGAHSCAARTRGSAKDGWAPVRLVRVAGDIPVIIDGWAAAAFLVAPDPRTSPEAGLAAHATDMLIVHESETAQCVVKAEDSAICTTPRWVWWPRYSPCSSGLASRFEPVAGFTHELEKVDGRWVIVAEAEGPLFLC